MLSFFLSTAEHSRPQSLRSFWPAAGIESSGSNHFEITKEITEFCPFLCYFKMVTCDQASLVFFRGGKERLIQLLDYSSAAP